MFEQVLDGSSVSIFVAFLAGFVTFFASCLLPLVPTYLAYLTGVSFELEEAHQHRWPMVRLSLYFVTGFVSVFVLLGMAAFSFAAVLLPYRDVISRFAGIFFILVGLFLAGVFKSSLLATERKFDYHGQFAQYRWLQALVLGASFGFGWTPCIGPVLAVILYWASQQATIWLGSTLLLVYGLGLGLPFVLIAAGFDRAVPWLKRHRGISRYATLVSGWLIVGVGVLMVFGQFHQLSLLMLNLFNLRKLAF